MVDPADWVDDHIADLDGRRFVVTGASAGLGAATTRLLARRGGHVVLAVRDVAKGEQVRDEILAADPDARLQVRRLDLADLTSIRQFADAIDRVDVLVNNAGVMATPRRTTADGFELQFGTNHLGHFALAGLLHDRLEASHDGRVVTVSSLAAQAGRLDFDDLMGHRSYRRWRAYAQSKLANLVFTAELQRRLSATGSATTALAAHPGIASTDLLGSMRLPRPLLAVATFGKDLVTQPATLGALPQIHAAASADVIAGGYYGPNGAGQRRGTPTLVPMGASALDEEAGRRLWERSQDLTGVVWPS